MLYLVSTLLKKHKALFIFLHQLITPILLFFSSCAKKIKAPKKGALDLEKKGFLLGCISVNPPVLKIKSRLVEMKKGKYDDKNICGNEIRLQQPEFLFTRSYYLFLPNFMILAF